MENGITIETPENTCRKKSEMTLNVKVDGIDEATEKAQRLSAVVREAQQLIIELRKMKLKLEIEV